MEKANQREITTGLVSGLDHSMIPRGSWISSLGVVISGDEDTEPFMPYTSSWMETKRTCLFKQ